MWFSPPIEANKGTECLKTIQWSFLAFKRGNFIIKKIYFYSTLARQRLVRLGGVLRVKKWHVQLGKKIHRWSTFTDTFLRLKNL